LKWNSNVVVVDVVLKSILRGGVVREREREKEERRRKANKLRFKVES